MKDIKTGRGIIRIQKTEFKGKEYIDIRKFYQDNETEEWKPTRKGISVPVDLLQDINIALQELIK